jgi:prepilin-type N-terminal cleavage/methylation domain-containing protein
MSHEVVGVAAVRRTALGVSHAARPGAWGRAPTKTQYGFSLIELVLVLALAGLIVGTAASTVPASLASLQLRAAAVQLGAALSRCRLGAMADGRQWRLSLVGSTSYTAGPADAAPSPERLPGQAFVATATSGGEVRCLPSGLAENATFTLALGTERRRVIVNQRGRVTIE